MANNCLITKLKSVVDNDNLKKLGSITFSVNPFTRGQTTYIGVSKGDPSATIKVKSKKYNLWLNGVEQNSKELSLTGNMDYNISTSELGDIVTIEDKYNITSIDMRIPVDMSAEDFTYMQNMISFKHRGGGRIEGNVTSLHTSPLKTLVWYAGQNTTLPTTQDFVDTCPNIESLWIDDNVSGELKALGKLVELTNFILVNNVNNVMGTVENFVASQVTATNPRTTGSISVNFINCPYITFDGDSTNVGTTTLSWQPNATAGRTDVTFNGTTITIDNTTGNKVS